MLKRKRVKFWGWRRQLWTFSCCEFKKKNEVNNSGLSIKVILVCFKARKEKHTHTADSCDVRAPVGKAGVQSCTQRQRWMAARHSAPFMDKCLTWELKGAAGDRRPHPQSGQWNGPSHTMGSWDPSVSLLSIKAAQVGHIDSRAADRIGSESPFPHLWARCLGIISSMKRNLHYPEALGNTSVSELK